GGGLLASHVFRGRVPPKGVAIVHGAAGIAGIVLLILVLVRTNPAGPVAGALGLFVVAALGGLYLMSQHRRGTVPSKQVTGGHALLAVVGLITLLVATFGT
ncbi:MAG: hypothetical protein ACODAG_11475, partial [Myxococcota bacterium]